MPFLVTVRCEEGALDMSAANRAVSGFRYLVSLAIPGDTSTGLKGVIIRAMSDTTTIAARVLQGIDPIWKREPGFLELYHSVRPVLTLDQKSAHILYKLVEHCRNIPGATAEVGVYKGGGSKIILNRSSPEKLHYMFDTFAGFPAVNSKEDGFWKQGDFNEVAFADIRAAFSQPNIRICRGRFPDTVVDVPADERFCFAHIDGDLYQTQFDGCSYFYPRMNPGGVMLLDNYGSLSCPGAQTSVDTFFEDKPEAVIYLPTGQAMVIKL
jgi:O-methyltransferase